MADFKNTKEGRLVAQKYADILHLSRPEPPAKHPRMSIITGQRFSAPSLLYAVLMMRFPTRAQPSCW